MNGPFSRRRGAYFQVLCEVREVSPNLVRPERARVLLAMKSDKVEAVVAVGTFGCKAVVLEAYGAPYVIYERGRLR